MTLKLFLMAKLKIELSKDKTLITHISKFARFLGYDIIVTRNQSVRKDRNGVKKRYYSYNCKLYAPKEAWINKLKSLGVLKVQKNGVWIPTPHEYVLSF